MNISRRNMLKLSAGSAALVLAGVHPVHAAKPAKKIPLGLQLYSVRHDCGKDLPGVLKAVGEMGYDGVEFAGYYGRTAEEIRELLDANGLVCCGTHAQLNTLLGDALPETVKFNKTIGNKYLIVPGMPRERLASVEATKETAKLFTELAAKVKDDGMRVGYHAHGGDFKKMEGTTSWEVLFENAGRRVIMQLDIGNCIGGGGDPIAMLKKFPKRSVTVHLKEHGGKPGAVIGEGDVDWDAVFELCETIGGTKWYVVEQERYAGEPLECVKKCIESLRKMGK